jgi:hypothetical protein
MYPGLPSRLEREIKQLYLERVLKVGVLFTFIVFFGSFRFFPEVASIKKCYNFSQLVYDQCYRPKYCFSYLRLFFLLRVYDIFFICLLKCFCIIR